MNFNYSKYFSDSIIAVCLLVMMILSLIVSLVYYGRLFGSKKHRRKDVFDFLCILIGCGLLLSINISKLVHGGAILLFEQEADKVQLYGQIEQIDELGYWGVPKLDYDGGSGTQLTISGIQCRTIYDISLNVGDYVLVEYLPGSRYILYICKVANS